MPKKPAKRAPAKRREPRIQPPSKDVAASIVKHKKTTRRAAMLDSFVNTYTGAGTTRDKSKAGWYQADYILSPAELEVLFESNDLAQRIVTKIVEDALRDGFSVRRCDHEEDDEEGFAEDSEDLASVEDQELASKILARLKKDGVRQMLKEAASWGRLFGDAGAIVLGVSGAGNLESPLDDSLVTNVEYLEVGDINEFQPERFYPRGEASHWRWSPVSPFGAAGSRGQIILHESRVIMFRGAPTTKRARQRNRGWHHSVLQGIYNVLVSFDGMWSSVDAMFADASQAVFHLQGLIESLASSDGAGEKDVQTRLELLDLMRSTAKAVMLDAGDEKGEGREDFKVVDRTSLGQIDGAVQQFFVRLACAARMPLTVLLGMSPSGMDATGESDMILWYNQVDTYRKDVLEPALQRLVCLYARACGDSRPEDWEIVWPELSRPKPLDVATTENMRMTALTALYTMNVLQPEEIAMNLARVAREGLTGLQIDLEPRIKALKAAYAELADRSIHEEELPDAGVSPAEKKSERKTPSKTAKKQV